MRNLKRVLALGLSAVTVVSLTACGSSGDAPAEATATPEANTEATEAPATPEAETPATGDGATIRFSWWGGDSRTAAYQEALEAFTAQTGINVKAEYGAWDGWETNMSSAFYGKTAPDVNQVNWNWLSSYSADGSIFVDLNEVSDVIDLTQFDDAALQQCIVAGELQAIPVALTGRIFYWNKSTFDAAGIEVPTTYEDLIKAGETFKTVLGDDYYPLALGEYDKMILMVHYLESKYGKNWVEDNQLQYSAEEIKDGMLWIHSLEEAHVIPTCQKIIGDGAASLDKNQNWIEGKYAGIFEWDSAAGKYESSLDATQNFEFIVGEPLSDLGEYKGGYTKVSMAMAITEGTPYVNEAAQLIEFLLNGDGAAILGSELGIPLSEKGFASAEAGLDGLVVEANAKVKENNTFQLDPKFEDSVLRNNTDGVYFVAMTDMSYDGTGDIDNIVDRLINGINDVLNK